MAGADLTLEDREWLQERSAILEYEAGLPRKEAEETAVKMLQKMKLTSSAVEEKLDNETKKKPVRCTATIDWINGWR